MAAVTAREKRDRSRKLRKAKASSLSRPARRRARSVAQAPEQRVVGPGHRPRGPGPGRGGRANRSTAPAWRRRGGPGAPSRSGFGCRRPATLSYALLRRVRPRSSPSSGRASPNRPARLREHGEGGLRRAAGTPCTWRPRSPAGRQAGDGVGPAAGGAVASPRWPSEPELLPVPWWSWWLGSGSWSSSSSRSPRSRPHPAGSPDHVQAVVSAEGRRRRLLLGQGCCGGRGEAGDGGGECIFLARLLPEQRFHGRCAVVLGDHCRCSSRESIPTEYGVRYAVLGR